MQLSKKEKKTGAPPRKTEARAKREKVREGRPVCCKIGEKRFSLRALSPSEGTLLLLSAVYPTIAPAEHGSDPETSVSLTPAGIRRYGDYFSALARESAQAARRLLARLGWYV